MAKQRILLVEPAYRNKYPPIGLMKIATAHLLRGDEVVFCKGMSVSYRAQSWDRIYITTLFTFYWDITVKTIAFYSKSGAEVLVGGILASLMPDELANATGIVPHRGPLTTCDPRILKHLRTSTDLSPLAADYVERGVDALPPDYSIFENVEIPYGAVLHNCYIARTSRGCSRGCDFCGVRVLEPTFAPRLTLTPVVKYQRERWGDKCGLLLLDDNILLSRQFDEIVDELISLGFAKGEKLLRKNRFVDFNQGLDLRLLTRHHVARLSSLAIRPLRLALDDIALMPTYERKLAWLLDAGFRDISIYVLYNHGDTPSELYRRLEKTARINEARGSRIYSFPMKFIPCTAKDRHHIGRHWTRRLIRGVQCVLNATHGIAPIQPEFFRRAFGKNLSDFLRIIQMPENYIIHRSQANMTAKINAWLKSYRELLPRERADSLRTISGGKGTFSLSHRCTNVQRFLAHYKDENRR